MKPHKWAKEIKAWADGEEIEYRIDSADSWDFNPSPDWNDTWEFRIKPQPKEPQYLYVYQLGFEYKFSSNKENKMQFSAGFGMCTYQYAGKIPLIIEVDDDTN